MKYFQFIVVVTLSTTSLLAQLPEGKNKELSFSGSYQDYSSASGFSNSGSILLSPRIGIFVLKGLEIEPEALLMVSSGSEPVYMLNGNVSYNFNPIRKSMPFLLIGYGISNTFPFFNVPVTRVDYSVNVLNVGFGMKSFVSDDIAIRLEFRYQKFSGQGSTVNYGYYSYTSKIDMKIRTIQFGFSYFL